MNFKCFNKAVYIIQYFIIIQIYDKMIKNKKGVTLSNEEFESLKEIINSLSL